MLELVVLDINRRYVFHNANHLYSFIYDIIHGDNSCLPVQPSMNGRVRKQVVIERGNLEVISESGRVDYSGLVDDVMLSPDLRSILE